MSIRRQARVASSAARYRTRGFTLAEAIIVIVITGILAATVAVFIRQPVQGFFDTTRRAALVDAADTALRRISRDLHEALPNSVRVSGTALEFLHIRSAGRYRDDGPGNPLDFTANDTSFDVLGPGVNVQNGDSIVVYNLGVPNASAYETAPLTTRRVAVTTFGPALTSVTISSTNPFPFASPARRFQVVDTPVSYVCSGTQMRRYWGYAIVNSPQPNPPSGGSNALAVDGLVIGGCNFAYASGTSQRDALVTLTLNLASGGETVRLVYQVHVNNAP